MAEETEKFNLKMMLFKAGEITVAQKKLDGLYNEFVNFTEEAYLDGEISGETDTFVSAIQDEIDTVKQEFILIDAAMERLSAMMASAQEPAEAEPRVD